MLIGVALFVSLVLLFGFTPKVCYNAVCRGLCVKLRLHLHIFGFGRVKSVLLHAVLKLVAQTCGSRAILGLVCLQIVCCEPAIGQ